MCLETSRNQDALLSLEPVSATVSRSNEGDQINPAMTFVGAASLEISYDIWPISVHFTYIDFLVEYFFQIFEFLLSLLVFHVDVVTLDRVPDFNRSAHRLVRCLHRACLRVNYFYSVWMTTDETLGCGGLAASVNCRIV
jgi:hypothetical protein